MTHPGDVDLEVGHIRAPDGTRYKFQPPINGGATGWIPEGSGPDWSDPAGRVEPVLDGLTPARRRGLEAVASAHPRSARYSNATHVAAPGSWACTVHWQVADWLIEVGLAVQPGVARHRLALSGRGLDACRQLGIEVGS